LSTAEKHAKTGSLVGKRQIYGEDQLDVNAMVDLRGASDVGTAFGSDNQLNVGRWMRESKERVKDLVNISRRKDWCSIKRDNVGTKIFGTKGTKGKTLDRRSLNLGDKSTA
jgi:hypothetical protein